MRKDFEPISEPPWRPSVDRFVAIRDPRRAQFSGKLFVVWILLGMAIATGVESTRAAEPAPDEPFQQEYRDGFVRGTTAAENDVRGLTIDRDGRVWAATAAGVRVVRAGALVEVPGRGVGGPAFAVAVAADGTVWVGAWDGLYRVEAGTLRRVAGLAGPVTLVAALGDRILVGNPTGLFERVAGQWRPIPGPWATCVRDVAVVDNALYIAAWSGLYRKESGKIQRLIRAVTVRAPGERGTAISRVSPPHNVADLSDSVKANFFAATLRGGGHAPTRERLPRADQLRSRNLAALATSSGCPDRCYR
jgi:hypothetical protein